MVEKGKIGSKIIRLNRVDSTNSYLKRIARALPEGTVVLAEEQTAGRGRRGRTWVGHRGKSLFMSFLLSYEGNADQMPLHMMWPAVAVVEALQSFGVTAGIKWPNDIILCAKKIGGILVESIITHEKKALIIIGVGLNLKQHSADLNGLPFAGSILSLADVNLDREELLTVLLDRLNREYRRLGRNGAKIMQQKWLQKCCHINRRVAVFTGERVIEGKFTGIDEYGFALVENKQEIQKITSFTKVLLRENYVAHH